MEDEIVGNYDVFHYDPKISLDVKFRRAEQLAQICTREHSSAGRPVGLKGCRIASQAAPADKLRLYKSAVHLSQGAPDYILPLTQASVFWNLKKEKPSTPNLNFLNIQHAGQAFDVPERCVSHPMHAGKLVSMAMDDSWEQLIGAES